MYFVILLLLITFILMPLTMMVTYANKGIKNKSAKQTESISWLVFTINTVNLFQLCLLAGWMKEKLTNSKTFESASANLSREPKAYKDVLRYECEGDPRLGERLQPTEDIYTLGVGSYFKKGLVAIFYLDKLDDTLNQQRE
jgi:hypothetical protein